MKKEFIHMKEYKITKLLLEKLDIDIEENVELQQDFTPLCYKDKQLIFPYYNECWKYNKSDSIIMRPFINMSHIQYLMDLYSTNEDIDIVFEYSDNKDKKTNDGVFYIKNKKVEYTVNLYGIKNISALMFGLLLKTVLGHDLFMKHINTVFLLDKKISSYK